MSFAFRQFSVDDSRCAMKVGTDGVLLGAWVAAGNAVTAVDAGAGSGVVSLLLAQRFPRLHITAVEIDGGATADCMRNFSASPWQSRLDVVCGPLEDYKPERSLDLIVSNPPFFTENLLSPDSRRALARHSADLSPLSLIDYAASNLSPHGSLAMITPMPAADDDSIIYHAEMKHLKLRRLALVSSRCGAPPFRCLWQFCRVDGPIERSSFSIRDRHNAYSPEYLGLVERYYLHL